MKLRLILLLTVAASAGRTDAADAKAPASTVPPPANAVPTKAVTPGAGTATTAAGLRSDSSVAPTATFDTFRVITDRNIFNPNRTGRRERNFEEAPPRLDIISLVGTMDSDKGLRAFFDGSASAFRKVLHVGESVDTFKVTKISPNVVELEHDGKTISVRVGQQLRRPEGADWNVTEIQRATAVADPARIDPNAPPVIPANADDITRRLMERRAKTLKQ